MTDSINSYNGGPAALQSLTKLYQTANRAGDKPDAVAQFDQPFGQKFAVSEQSSPFDQWSIPSAKRDGLQHMAGKFNLSDMSKSDIDKFADGYYEMTGDLGGKVLLSVHGANHMNAIRDGVGAGPVDGSERVDLIDRFQQQIQMAKQMGDDTSALDKFMEKLDALSEISELGQAQHSRAMTHVQFRPDTFNALLGL